MHKDWNEYGPKVVAAQSDPKRSVAFSMEYAAAAHFEEFSAER